MADSAEPRTPPNAEAPARRFSAFISYSHADEKFVRKLHRMLESYRLPRRLLKTHGAAAGRRLKPLFRDSDELSASYDLSAAVREAIEASDYLIVVCSPAAAKSGWIGREIEQFRALRGDEAILATIIAGSSETAFPPALHGRPGGPTLSPLAADFRPQGGGQRLALLRLVAALAGVHLDELVQRDAQDQVRRIALAGAGAIAGIAVVAALAVYGLNARHDAEAQRARAGSLNTFMLTDLRKGLQSAGRLDLLTAVNRAALEACKSRDLSRLPSDTLEQCAKARQAAGEDDERQGDLKSAQAQFEEARRITAALLAAKPNDPQRIFDHAQSEYWVGFVNWRNGDGVVAKARFEAYARLAAQLVRIDPKNDKWQMEIAYAANNLGMLALRQAGNPAEAERQFREALRVQEIIALHKHGDPETMGAIANALAWLADSQRLKGALPEALATREAQRKILSDLVARNPLDVDAQEHMLGHDLAVARIEVDQGSLAQAARRLEAGHKASLALLDSHPENKDIVKQARIFELFEVRTWLKMPVGTRPSAAQLTKVLGNCVPTTTGATNQELSDLCGVLLARVRSEAGDRAGALAALEPVKAHLAAQHDVLTAHWGVNLREEAGAIQLAASGGEVK
jgi:tetratricopeptide (TPR) repeat protein